MWSCLQIRFQTTDKIVVPTKHCGVVRVTGWAAPRDTGPSGLLARWRHGWRLCPRAQVAAEGLEPLGDSTRAMVPSPGLCGKGDVEFVRVEDEGPPRRARVPVGLVEQLEEPGADVHGDTHDDALGHPWNQPERRSERFSPLGELSGQDGCRLGSHTGIGAPVARHTHWLNWAGHLSSSSMTWREMAAGLQPSPGPSVLLACQAVSLVPLPQPRSSPAPISAPFSFLSPVTLKNYVILLSLHLQPMPSERRKT